MNTFKMEWDTFLLPPGSSASRQIHSRAVTERTVIRAFYGGWNIYGKTIRNNIKIKNRKSK
jgi:hypothetical protein